MALRHVGKVNVGALSSRYRVAGAKLQLVSESMDAEDTDEGIAGALEDAYAAGIYDAQAGLAGVGSLDGRVPADATAQNAYVAGFLNALGVDQSGAEDQTGVVVHHQVELDPQLRASLEALRARLSSPRMPLVALGGGVLAGLVIAALVFMFMNKLDED